MFSHTHILYMLSSAVLTAILLTLVNYLLKDREQQNRFLQFFAVLTVLIHYSNLWVEFFQTGEAMVESNHLLPIHPCNVMMWLLLIVAFCKDKETPLCKVTMEFAAFAGTMCAIIGIMLNENFISNPTLTDYDVLKGLLSHSTMLVGCLYLFVGKYIKIRLFNTVSVAMGLLFFLVDGTIVNALYKWAGFDSCNSMYLEALPFPEYPWLTTSVIGVVGCIVVFSFTAIYEAFTLPKEEQTIYHMKNFIKDLQTKRNY